MSRNPNLDFLHNAFVEGAAGAILEGSSRSGKTWSSIDFIIWLAAQFPKSEIIIVRETYNSFKTTLYNDFNRRLPMAGFISPFEVIRDVSMFWLFDCKISLLGADKVEKFHGAGSDFFFINEAIDVPQAIFDQLEQRNRRFWWMDYNPKVSDHWIYNRVAKRPDVRVFRSTFLQNPYITKQEREKVLSYDPGNPANVAAGTADDYMWKVYGLGERASHQGLVYPNVSWISALPLECDKESFGLDLGYTNSPAALCHVKVTGNNLFAEKLLYHPFQSAADMAPYLRKAIPDNKHFWVDSADPLFIADLRRLGFNALAVKKPSGYKVNAIGNIKRFKLHFVDDQDVRTEQSNYRYRTINGISLDEPVDDHDHFFDALMYATMHEIRGIL